MQLFELSIVDDFGIKKYMTANDIEMLVLNLDLNNIIIITPGTDFSHKSNLKSMISNPIQSLVSYNVT